MRIEFNALYLSGHIILIDNVNLSLKYKVPSMDVLEPFLCTLRHTYLRSFPFYALLFQTKLSYRYCTVRAGRSGDRIPAEAKFAAPFHTGRGPTQSSIHWVSGYSWG